MSPDPGFSPHYLPILIINPDAAAAELLASQLRHRGFHVDTASSWSHAETSIHARHYGSMVVVVNPTETTDLDCLAALRAKASRTWIIAISTLSTVGYSKAPLVFFDHGADSVMVVPFSVEELTSRLLSFSHRSRPP